MVALSQTYQERCLWHLVGTAAGVMAGDLARIYEAMNNIPSDSALRYVQELIDTCDEAWRDLKVAKNITTVSAETYAGDLNRTVARGQRNLELIKYYRDLYYYWVDQLARKLWTPEYTTPDSDYYRYARFGGEYVNSLPGSKGASGDVNFGFQYA